jgi:hypothetical protein
MTFLRFSGPALSEAGSCVGADAGVVFGARVARRAEGNSAAVPAACAE